MSSNYFKSFRTLSEESTAVPERLPNAETYFAHIHDEKPPETLSQHIELVRYYAITLVSAHQLDTPVDRLIRELVKSKTIEKKVEAGNFIKKLFWNTIIYHDHGKINENFQNEKMQNSFFKKNEKNRIGSRHSVLSATIFVAEYIQHLLNDHIFNQNEQSFLALPIYLFAGVILKHHASYYEHSLNIPSDWLKATDVYLAQLNITVDLNLLINGFENLQNERAFLQITDSLFKDVAPFSLFALLRLCYSLLTASDYYATNEYVSDLRVQDFGVLSTADKAKMQKAFQNLKSYNKEFFERRKYFLSLPIVKLQHRNPDNLNRLRQKIMAEIIHSIEQNSDDYVFYLEAPTGAGKTNLSLAIALELLKHDAKINKVYYVFPFTTLITQTAQSIKETLNLSTADMIQLHSRSGFHSKIEEKKDGQYGQDHQNYIDNLFVNYPLVLMTHIKFFDILKGTSKENIYILHRLANSVVIMDELQSYPPEQWAKIKYFITNYAYFFNIRFVLMSATLPKLDNLKIPNITSISMNKRFVPLLPHPSRYFNNPNFKGRVIFDFSLTHKSITTEELADFVFTKCERYALENENGVKGIIEFIFKKTASAFYDLIKNRLTDAGYSVFLLSGTILEPRRKEIIEAIKTMDNQIHDNDPKKLLLITTQVVEAGVDIDMDIGFKDQSLIDSDEQLAGRVNRNARPIPSKVYLFKLDKSYTIYGHDLRYKLTRDEITQKEYQEILRNKRFNMLYDKVCNFINKENSNEYIRGIHSYIENMKHLRYSQVDRDFQLISTQTVTVFVPLSVPAKYFSPDDIHFISELLSQNISDVICGEDVWEIYIHIINDTALSFVKKRINLKRIYGIMSQFMFSVYANTFILQELQRYANLEIYNKYQILYLSNWQEIYSYSGGINEQNFTEAMFF